MATKIYNNIQEKLKSCKLEQVMHASNIFGTGLGERKLKLIIDKYPDILTKTGDLLSLIIGIDGFAEKTAQRFVDKLPEFKQFLKQHPKIKLCSTKKLKIKKHLLELNIKIKS